MIERYRQDMLRKQAVCKEIDTNDLDEKLIVLRDGNRAGENFYIEHRGAKYYSIDMDADTTSALRFIAIQMAKGEDPLYEPSKPLGWEMDDIYVGEEKRVSPTIADYMALAMASHDMMHELYDKYNSHQQLFNKLNNHQQNNDAKTNDTPEKDGEER